MAPFRLCLLSLLWTGTLAGQPAPPPSSEEDRILKYHERNYTWPADYVPNTEGWKKLFDHRFRQAAEMQDVHQRFEGFAQSISAAMVQPNFTEHGFGLARAPDDLMEALRQGIKDGLAAGPREERDIEVIHGDNPWFIDRPDLTQRVLKELQHYSETWVGMELTPVTAYGFRLYRNGSTLDMHVDKPQSHVISFILHIDSSEDAEPWPILIEDFHGNTHEVILKSGDLLFYESSKCFHGRPKTFKGSWYTSVFVHYHPKYGWLDHPDRRSEKKWAIPTIWSEQPTTHFEIPAEMIGTGITEPNCPNNWCQSQYSIKWSGPGEEGYYIAPNGEKYPFDPKRMSCEDSDPECEEWTKRDSNECESNANFMLKNCRKSCGACSMPVGRESPELLKQIYNWPGAKVPAVGR